jgi:outer membrane murein-binding lipoprotein Lpp
MIALLVGVAFAGMAASTNQGSPPWNSLEQKIDALNTNVTNLQGNVSAINADIAAMQTDVSGIASDLDSTKSDVADIKTDLGNVTKMETVYGSYEVLLFSGAVTVYEVQYDEPRHVSLTLQWDGLVVPTTEAIAVDAFVTGTPSWPEGIVYICLPDYAAHGIETVEFNADHWFINVLNDHVWNDHIYYAATVTYPLQP